MEPRREHVVCESQLAICSGGFTGALHMRTIRQCCVRHADPTHERESQLIIGRKARDHALCAAYELAARTIMKDTHLVGRGGTNHESGRMVRDDVVVKE